MKNNFLLLFICLFPMGLFAQNWEQIGSGVNEAVRNMYFDSVSNLLYIDGMFKFAGENNVEVNGITAWNGTEFLSLGSGMDYCNPNNCAISPGPIIRYKGTLFVAVSFLTVGGGVTAMGLAIWDGENWHLVGDNYGGDFSDIKTVAVFEEELYIGGTIVEWDGNVGNGILKLEGNSFVDVGGSFPDPNDQVHDLRVFNGKLYAMGIFESVGNGVQVDDIAAWDGEQWYGLNGSFDNRVLVSEEINGELYIGGGGINVSGEPFNRLAKWNCQQPYDSCGTGQATAIQPTAVSTPQVRLFPNPVRSSFSISVDPAFSQSIDQLVLYNALGEMVKSWEVTDSNQAFGVEGLPGGVYFYTINGKGRMVGSGKVVVW